MSATFIIRESFLIGVIALAIYSHHRGAKMSSSQEKWDRLFPWVESIMGGRITWRERHARWRPAWFFDVEVDGKTIPLYWRGFRGQTRDGKPSVYDQYPIEGEGRLLQVLEVHDIPVPHVYGFCPDPRGILMSRVPGKPEFHHIPDEEERESVARDFMDSLARTHSIPLEAFESIGMIQPNSPEEQALNHIKPWEDAYRGSIVNPVPLMEFTLKWLRQNVPKNPMQSVLVQGDTGPGQFLFKDGKVTAVVDWEFAHLGHPMEDLALIRGRDLCTPFGDLRERFHLYSELSGIPLDMEALRYYSVTALLITPIGTASFIEEAPPALDFAEYFSWYVLYSRAMVECLAEAIGVKLDPVFIPDPIPTRRSKVFDLVLKNLSEEQVPQIKDGYAAYRMQIAIRLVDYLRSAEKLGPAIDSIELDDLEAILGHWPANLEEGNAALTKLIADAGPEQDEMLIRYFYRHLIREETMLKPAMGEMAILGKLSPID